MADNSSWDLMRRKPKKIPREYSSYNVDSIFEAPGQRFSKKSEQMQRIEQAMARIGEIERKMQKGDNYFSLYYDLKKQATKFLELYNELEGKKVFVDGSTYKKIMAVKDKLDKRII